MASNTGIGMRRRVKVPKRIAPARTTRQYLLKFKISIVRGHSHSLIKRTRALWLADSRAGAGKNKSLEHSAVSGS